MSRQPARHNFGTGDWLRGVARTNPEGLLIVAAGIALLMRRQAPILREARRFLANEEHEDRSSRARSGGGGPSAKKRKRDQDDTEEGAGFSQDPMTLLRGAQSKVEDTMHRMTEEQPLSLALGGLAAGAALAALFPATRVEQRTLGPAAQRLTSTAGRAGKQLRESTNRAGERLMQAAEENLGEVANEVVDAVGSSLLSGNENEPDGVERSAAGASVSEHVGSKGTAPRDLTASTKPAGATGKRGS